MALTGAQIVTEVCDIVGKSTAASSVSGADLQDRVLKYVNWGQKRIARVYSFHELNVNKLTAATVTDIKTYPLETGTNNLGLTGVKDIHSIRLIDSHNSRKLERWSYRKFDEYYPRPENYATGRPRIYARWGNAIDMFKIPSAAYTLYIRYSKWPTDLTTTTSSDYSNKDQLLVTAGVMETYLALEEYADAKVWWERLLGMMNDAIKAEGDVDWSPDAEPHISRPAYGSGEPYNDPFGTPDDPLYGYA